MNVFYSCILGAIFAFSTLANAQAVHGVLRVVKGNVQIKSGKTGASARARVGEKVYPKDTIITAKDSRAKIVMVDNNEINVSPDSQIEIQNYEYDPSAGKKDVLLNVIYGKVRSKVEQKYDGKSSKFQIKTPSAVAGVRGTDFLTGHVAGVTNVVTFEGRVEFGNPGPNGTIQNPVTVVPGTQASVTGAGTPPTPPAPVPKDQLAKIDGDTKADAPKADAGTGAGETRQPAAGDKNGEKKEETKQDGADKNQGAGNDKQGATKQDGGDKNQGAGNDRQSGTTQDGSDKNKGAGNDKNGNNGRGGDNKGANAGGSSGKSGGVGAPGAPGSPGSGGAASDGSATGDSRAPASTGPTAGGTAPAPTAPGTPPPPGPVAGGCTMCSGPTAPMLPPVMPVMPTLPPVLPYLPPPPVCTACIDIPQSGSSKLIIHVNTQ